MRSNLTVGCPSTSSSSAATPAGPRFPADRRRRALFPRFRERWSSALRLAHQSIPPPPYRSAETGPVAGGASAMKTRKHANKTRNAMAAKVAMVTGAGTGVGKAAALALAAGFDVVLTGRRAAPLGRRPRGDRTTGRKALVVTADVGNGLGQGALREDEGPRPRRPSTPRRRAGHPLRGPDLRAGGRRRQPDRRLPLRPAGGEDVLARRPGRRIINNGSISATTPRPTRALHRHRTPSPASQSIALDGGPSTSPPARSTSATPRRR